MEKQFPPCPLQKWDAENDIYFAGWIMPDMRLKRECNEGEIDYFEINENGEIIAKVTIENQKQ